MIENELSRKHEDRINAMKRDSTLRDLPYGDSIVFPDEERHFLVVGLGDRVVVRELCEYPISWDTKNMLAIAVAAVERLKDAPDSLWKHRAQINCLLDLRVYLPMYRGLDSSIVPVLRAGLAESDYARFRTYIRVELIKQLKEQVKGGGPTHFFEINEMLEIPELAVHVPKILELRKREIQGVTLVDRNGVIDLRPIIMTAWGFELVQALGLGLETNSEGCDAIQRKLLELELSVNISKNQAHNPTPVNMGVGLSQYIQSLFK
ncbi:MAG: hypothetical protein ACFFEA_02430 [Candidatus Thorarchaeota archaeon]